MLLKENKINDNIRKMNRKNEQDKNFNLLKEQIDKLKVELEKFKEENEKLKKNLKRWYVF